MDTITEEYRALNRKLHDDGAYGIYGDKWAERVREIIDAVGASSVLDYGCGQGALGRTLAGLGTSWTDYDPAIDGKQETPPRADLVVCTDVLEHIEPDLLDNVIADLARVTGRAAFLVIATRPAKKFLADGRNAHLIVENAAWWRERLEPKFHIAQWHVTDGEIQAVVAPFVMVDRIIGKSAVSDDARFNNYLVNRAKVSARVPGRPRHDGRAVIVGYGPSLQETWHEIRSEQRLHDATVVSTSGAHDFLIERGIIPDIHIEVDPREHKAAFTRNPHPDVKYWIASCVHPSLIDQLVAAGVDVRLFHVANSETDLKIIAPESPDKDDLLVAGGGSVGCRALNVMFLRGNRTFSVYGMDCSFGGDGVQHAGAHSGKPQIECVARVGTRMFRTSTTMLYTARGFMSNWVALQNACVASGEPCIPGTTDRLEMFLHGDGLLQEMVRQSVLKAA